MSKKKLLRRPKPRPRESDIDTVQRQISHRWSARLASGGWTPVCDYFLRNYHRLKISHSEAMVIIHLMSFKWDAAAPFPALKTIATRMGITAPSVRTHLRSLEKRQYLKREMQTGRTNLFYLDGLFEALEELMDEDENTLNERERQRAERRAMGLPAA